MSQHVLAHRCHLCHAHISPHWADASKVHPGDVTIAEDTQQSRNTVHNSTFVTISDLRIVVTTHAPPTRVLSVITIHRPSIGRVARHRPPRSSTPPSLPTCTGQRPLCIAVAPPPGRRRSRPRSACCSVALTDDDDESISANNLSR
jgi:hypothetical protein